MTAALTVERLSIRFGGLTAVEDATFEVREGEVLSLIGPNGAGKTSLFNAITGYLRAAGGEVSFRGRRLTGLKPHAIAAALGVVRTFQKTSLFGGESVLDNVLIGLHLRSHQRPIAIMLGLPAVARDEREQRAAAWDILRFMALEARAGETAASLPYGEQRLLEVAIALAARPTLLLLDEPVSGMNPAEKARFMGTLAKIRERGITVLLVEHDMRTVMGVSDRVICLSQGRIIADGSPKEIQAHPEVIGLSARGRSVLRVDGLQCRYGRVAAVRDLSISVERAELVVLIGANGAGKTTTLKAISGLIRPAAGTIRFEGVEVTGASPRRMLSLGVAHCPEGRRVFPYMSVRENLEMGCYLRTDRAGIERDMDQVFERFPILRERRDQAAGTLSGGEQQMLAVGRALMSRPKLVLFDEPSLGLAPNLVAQTFDIIRRIRAEGVTVVMVEQNAFEALELCDRAYVLEQGRIAMTGTGAELLDNPHVKAAYLGIGDVPEAPSLNRGSLS